MPYDEKRAARVRALLANRTDADERKMFGGLTFMIGGNMCCGVNGDELIVRVDPEREREALTRPHARPMDLTGRQMRGFVTVRQDGLEGEGLSRWVEEAVARAESLLKRQPASPSAGSDYRSGPHAPHRRLG